MGNYIGSQAAQYPANTYRGVDEGNQQQYQAYPPIFGEHNLGVTVE